MGKRTCVVWGFMALFSINILAQKNVSKNISNADSLACKIVRERFCIKNRSLLSQSSIDNNCDASLFRRHNSVVPIIIKPTMKIAMPKKVRSLTPNQTIVTDILRNVFFPDK